MMNIIVLVKSIVPIPPRQLHAAAFTIDHSKAWYLVLFVVVFAVLLLCLVDPIWHCGHLIGEEGAWY